MLRLPIQERGLHKMLLTKLKIWGHPAILKNSKEICALPVRGAIACRDCGAKKHFHTLISSKRAKEYAKFALPVLMKLWSGKKPLEGKLWLKLTFFGAWKSESKSHPDQSNLYEMPQDLLTQAGVIIDDRQVKSHDESRIVDLCDLKCPKREVFKSGARKGQLKDNCGAIGKCPYEHVDIEIHEYIERDYVHTFEKDF